MGSTDFNNNKKLIMTNITHQQNSIISIILDLIATLTTLFYYIYIKYNMRRFSDSSDEFRTYKDRPKYIRKRSLTSSLKQDDDISRFSGQSIKLPRAKPIENLSDMSSTYFKNNMKSEDNLPFNLKSPDLVDDKNKELKFKISKIFEKFERIIDQSDDDPREVLKKLEEYLLSIEPTLKYTFNKIKKLLSDYIYYQKNLWDFNYIFISRKERMKGIKNTIINYILGAFALYELGSYVKNKKDNKNNDKNKTNNFSINGTKKNKGNKSTGKK